MYLAVVQEGLLVREVTKATPLLWEMFPRG